MKRILKNVWNLICTDYSNPRLPLPSGYDRFVEREKEIRDGLISNWGPRAKELPI